MIYKAVINSKWYNHMVIYMKNFKGYFMPLSPNKNWDKKGKFPHNKKEYSLKSKSVGRKVWLVIRTHVMSSCDDKHTNKKYICIVEIMCIEKKISTFLCSFQF